ncbi:MAG: 1-acyl-sn-glycerol-3-phosphate acyltransferase [Clostridia bacterium]|nr:1-acyl-sn-glycerol-3-phosphate acyltransferase [Clostridia bacterium]
MEKKQNQENLSSSKPKMKKKTEITVKANRKGRHIMPLLSFLRVLVVPVFWILRPFRFYGNWKTKDGACIYICNHYGLMDIAYPACTTWEGLHYVAKKEVEKMPVVNFLFRKVKGISVNRDGNDVRALLDCFKCLKNGEKICIFPEGTRNKTGAELQPFRHGAAAIAIKAKAPIIPIMIYKKPRYFRMTHVLVGDPVELAEYYDRKLTETDYSEADAKLYNIMLDLRKKHKEFLETKKAK